MSKIPQEAIEAVSLKLQAAFAPIMVRKSATELLEAAFPFLADAARAQGAEVVPVAWQFRFRGRDGLWGRWTTTNVPVDPDNIDPNFEKRPLYTTPPAPQPTDREKVLEDALRPFAERANRYNEIPGLIQFADDVELWQDAKNKGMEIDITVGDLRRARAALTGGEA